MLTMPCCGDTNAWAWVIATGLGVGPVTALLARQLIPAYVHGKVAKVILLGIAGAVAGAAIAQRWALFTPSPALLALCAAVGSLVLLDLNHLMRRSRL